MTEPEVRCTYSFTAEGTVTIIVDWDGTIYVNGEALPRPTITKPAEVDWDARAEPAPPPIQVRQCSCGANVDIVNGRWERHRHDHKAYVCPMSGQPLDGDLGVLTDRELREVAQLQQEAYRNVSSQVYEAIEERWRLGSAGPVVEPEAPYPNWSSYSGPGDMSDPLPGQPTMDLTEDGIGHSDYVQRMIDGLRAEREARAAIVSLGLDPDATFHGDMCNCPDCRDDGMDDPRNGIPFTRPRRWPWSRR